MEELHENVVRGKTAEEGTGERKVAQNVSCIEKQERKEFAKIYQIIGKVEMSTGSRTKGERSVAIKMGAELGK